MQRSKKRAPTSRELEFSRWRVWWLLIGPGVAMPFMELDGFNMPAHITASDIVIVDGRRSHMYYTIEV